MATRSSLLAWEIPWTEGPGYSPWGHREIERTDRAQLTPPERPSATPQPPGPRSELAEPDSRGLSLLGSECALNRLYSPCP